MPNQLNSHGNKTKIRRTVDEWRVIISGFPESQLTLEKYCQMQGIATSGFYNWRKRFEAEAFSSEPGFIEIIPPSQASQSPPDMLDHRWRLELQLGDGVILRVR